MLCHSKSFLAFSTILKWAPLCLAYFKLFRVAAVNTAESQSLSVLIGGLLLVPTSTYRLLLYQRWC